MAVNVPELPIEEEVKPATYGGESPAVMLLTFTNESKPPAAMKFTLRARQDENEFDLITRAKLLNAHIEADPDLTGFVWREHEFARFPSKKGAAKSATIHGDEFVLVAVMRRETENQKDKGKPNQFMRAIGEQDGEKVWADCYMGNSGWTPDNTPGVTCGFFPNFAEYKIEEEKKMGDGVHIVVKVKYNEKYYKFDIVEFVKPAVTG